MSTTNEPQPYQVETNRSAVKALKDLPAKDRERILDRIEDLADDPRPHQVEKLTDSGGLYRIRVGDYRVIYEIDDTDKRVTVVAIGNRRDVYR
jgi:mRNA interferase RelE/StbE